MKFNKTIIIFILILSILMSGCSNKANEQDIELLAEELETKRLQIGIQQGLEKI